MGNFKVPESNKDDHEMLPWIISYLHAGWVAGGLFSDRSVVQEIPANGLLFVPGLASGTGGWVQLKKKNFLKNKENTRTCSRVFPSSH